LVRFKDLDAALSAPVAKTNSPNDEWRVHFHIPLHSRPPGEFQTTTDHILGLLDVLCKQPDLCHHLEMETYTWAVLPEQLKARNVADQIVAEYRWTLDQLAQRGLAGSQIPATPASGRTL